MSFGRPTLAFLLAALALAAACSLVEPAPPGPPADDARNGEAVRDPRPAPGNGDDVESAAALEILRDADRVEPLLLTPVLEGDDLARIAKPENANEFVDGFPIRARGKELGEPFADELELFLVNDRNFAAPAPGEAERCVFTPEVAFVAYEGTEWNAVVVDFDCNFMTATSSKGQLVLPSLSFAPGRAELVELAKKAFPDDAQIQALK